MWFELENTANKPSWIVVGGGSEHLLAMSLSTITFPINIMFIPYITQH